MTDYYFLGTALPELQLEVPPELSFYELVTLLKENLRSEDLEKATTLRRYYDMLNIEAFWKEQELNHYGNWTSVELEEALLEQAAVPQYLGDFLGTYQSDRVKHFPQLLAAYFRSEAEETEGFLRDYLALERELRLVMVAFRAKRLNRDVLRELRYEDPEETLIAQIFAQKDAKEFEPPERYEALKPIFEEYADRPDDLHRALLNYRFEKVQEMIGVGMFSIDKILGYLIQVILIEESLHLDQQKGLELVDTIVERNT